MVCDVDPTSESDVWQQNMAEKVRNRCPLTLLSGGLTTLFHSASKDFFFAAWEGKFFRMVTMTWGSNVDMGIVSHNLSSADEIYNLIMSPKL